MINLFPSFITPFPLLPDDPSYCVIIFCSFLQDCRWSPQVPQMSCPDGVSCFGAPCFSKPCTQQRQLAPTFELLPFRDLHWRSTKVVEISKVSFYAISLWVFGKSKVFIELRKLVSIFCDSQSFTTDVKVLNLMV